MFSKDDTWYFGPKVVARKLAVCGQKKYYRKACIFVADGTCKYLDWTDSGNRRKGIIL